MSRKDLRECDINLTNGPIDAYPSVTRALSKTVIFDYDPDFRQFYADVHTKLAKALQTSTKPVIVQGELVLGLEASAGAIIAPEDKVLNLVTGFYSKAFEKYAARYAKEVIELDFTKEQVIAPAVVRKALAADPAIKLVAMVHHETPAGIVNPLAEIGAIVREHGAYLLADTTSSWGGMDINPDSTKTDLFVTTVHKCLGGLRWCRV